MLVVNINASCGLKLKALQKLSGISRNLLWLRASKSLT